MDRGFKVVMFSEFRKLGLSKLDPKPKVVFVNRRKAFKPYEDTLRRYTEFMRRYQGRKPAQQKEFALRGSHYEPQYRRRLLNNKDSMKEMRALSTLSRKGLVYMVADKDRPDAKLIVNICRQMIGSEVWK